MAEVVLIDGQQLDPTSFGDIVRGLHVYGCKVLRPEALMGAFYVID